MQDSIESIVILRMTRMNRSGARECAAWEREFYELSPMAMQRRDGDGSVERAFGGLVARWGIFWKPLRSRRLDRQVTIIRAGVALHNLCVDAAVAARARPQSPPSPSPVLGAGVTWRGCQVTHPRDTLVSVKLECPGVGRDRGIHVLLRSPQPGHLTLVARAARAYLRTTTCTRPCGYTYRDRGARGSTTSPARWCSRSCSRPK